MVYRYNNRQLAADADVTDTSVENLQQCMALFLDRPNCQLFSYYQQNNTCKLYDLASDLSSGYSVANGFVFKRFCTSGMFLSNILTYLYLSTITAVYRNQNHKSNTVTVISPISDAIVCLRCIVLCDYYTNMPFGFMLPLLS